MDIAGHDYEITQSPGLLHGNREGGTTGAVLWKVSPLVAAWLASDKNLLWESGILHRGATVVELGCGIAGVIGLSLFSMIGTYLLTDQDYVLKRLEANVNANTKTESRGMPQPKSRLFIAALDWERDSASNVFTAIGKNTINLVIACDCIYNDFLVQPFVETCVDMCKLAESRRTMLLVAQQLRSDDVVAKWLDASLSQFDVWRISDEYLSTELASGTGFVIHLLLLKEDGC